MNSNPCRSLLQLTWAHRYTHTEPRLFGWKNRMVSSEGTLTWSECLSLSWRGGGHSDGQLYNLEGSREHALDFITSRWSLTFPGPRSHLDREDARKALTGETWSFSWARGRRQLEIHRQMCQRENSPAGAWRCGYWHQKSLQSVLQSVVLGNAVREWKG